MMMILIIILLILDVVARRRLRASRSQIEQATKAARSRRVQLEDTIRSWLLTDALTRDELTGGAAAGGSGGGGGSDFGATASYRQLSLSSSRAALRNGCVHHPHYRLAYLIIDFSRLFCS